MIPLPRAGAPAEGDPPPPPPQRAGGRIMNPSDGSPTGVSPPAPIREERKEVIPPPAKAAPPTPTFGDLYWVGVFDKKTIVTVQGSGASVGSIDGKALPGKPVQIETSSPAVEIVEQPRADNGWATFKFRMLRNTKTSATVNFRWRLKN